MTEAIGLVILSIIAVAVLRWFSDWLWYRFGK